jgi:hypothetical protein
MQLVLRDDSFVLVIRNIDWGSNLVKRVQSNLKMVSCMYQSIDFTVWIVAFVPPKF